MQAVSDIQNQYPTICVNVPVHATRIAKALGFKINTTSTIHRARLEYSTIGDNESLFGDHHFTISLNKNISPDIGRFAVAHEIGHAILLAHYPENAAKWNLELRELFADSFASELLIPKSQRPICIERFHGLKTPGELRELASTIGISTYSLLTFASKNHSWFKDNDAIWLRLKYITNKYTNRDPKLRIASAHFDKSRFYVPSNQGFSRFCATDKWLSGLMPGEESSCIVEYISLKSVLTNERVKYGTLCTPAELRIMRLKPSGHDSASYYLLLAKIKRD